MTKIEPLLDAMETHLSWFLKQEKAIAALFGGPQRRQGGNDLESEIQRMHLLQASLANFRNPDAPPLAVLIPARGSPNNQVYLNGELIGWVDKGIRSDDGENRTHYSVYRPNKWMYKRPSYETLQEAVDRVVDEWHAVKKEETAMIEVGETPTNSEAGTPSHTGQESISAHDLMMAFAGWMKVYTARTGKPSTLKDVAEAFDVSPRFVGTILSNPLYSLEKSGDGGKSDLYEPIQVKWPVR